MCLTPGTGALQLTPVPGQRWLPTGPGSWSEWPPPGHAGWAWISGPVLTCLHQNWCPRASTMARGPPGDGGAWIRASPQCPTYCLVSSETHFEFWSYSYLVKTAPSSSGLFLRCYWLEANFLVRKDSAGQLGWTCRTLPCCDFCLLLRVAVPLPASPVLVPSFLRATPLYFHLSPFLQGKYLNVEGVHL